MTTAAQKLLELSGLQSGSAGAHLIQLSTSGLTAAERLLSRSTLSSGSASAHLNSISGNQLVGANSNQSNNSSLGIVLQTHLVNSTISQSTATSSINSVAQTHLTLSSASISTPTSSVGNINIFVSLFGANSSQPNTSITSPIKLIYFTSADPVQQLANSSSGTVEVSHRVSSFGAVENHISTSGSILQIYNLTTVPVEQNSASKAAAVTISHILSTVSNTNTNTSSFGSIIQNQFLISAPSIQDNIAEASPIVQIHLLLGSNSTQTALSEIDKVFADLSPAQVASLNSFVSSTLTIDPRLAVLADGLLNILTPAQIDTLANLLVEGSMPTVNQIADELMSRLTTQPISVDLINAAKASVSQTIRNDLMHANIDVNVKLVNDVNIKGTGQPGNEWGPS